MKSYAAVLIVLIVVSGLGLFIAIELITTPVPPFSYQSRTALDFVWFCVADGALTMVLVQLCRSLVPIRGRFHRKTLVEWLGLTIPVTPEPNNSSNEPSEWERVIKELYKDSKGPLPENAAAQFEKFSLHKSSIDAAPHAKAPFLYDLPLEQLCAQISSAAERALAMPRESPDFLLCLVGPEGAQSVLDLLGVSATEKPKSNRSGQPPIPQVKEPPEIAAARAQAALVRLIQRRIDAFQIRAGALWRRNLRAWVVVVGVIFGWLLAFPSNRHEGLGVWMSYAFYGVLGGAMGGYVAMVLRDLTAIVELKRR